MRWIQLITFILVSSPVLAAPPVTTPATAPTDLPGIHIDVNTKTIRVECEQIDCKAPLEFFCVLNGTSEHESALRTAAKPSNIHLALLMLGLEPGEGIRYSEETQKWLPPHGPPLNISCEFEKDGKKVVVPAYRMLRDIRTQKPMRPMTWIFIGSHVMDDGHYAADVTGYVLTVVNFQYALIDIPDLASSSNETLEWQINTDVAPPGHTPVTLIIQPAEKVETSGTTQPATTPTDSRGSAISDVSINQEKVDRLTQNWKEKVAPHQAVLQEAAQAQYQTITALRREQQRLIDEADRIQRTIDDLENKYQEMTTPKPEAATIKR